MKSAFFGTPEFAATIMKGLAGSRHQIVLVVTSPDKPVGRGQVAMKMSKVKEAALSAGIKVVETDAVSEPASVETLRESGAEIGIVAAFGQKLSLQVLEAFPRGCVNVHASVLPDYRGASPIHWALINGETSTGVTIFQMNRRIDRGSMLSFDRCPIHDSDDFESLHDRLANLGSLLVVRTLDDLEAGLINPVPQPSGGRYYGRLTKEDGRLDFSVTAWELRNRIKALGSWPGTFTTFKGKKLQIIEAEPYQDLDPENCFSTGQVVWIDPPSGFFIKTSDGNLLVRKVKMESRNSISARDFISGYRLVKGDCFGGE